MIASLLQAVLHLTHANADLVRVFGLVSALIGHATYKTRVTVGNKPRYDDEDTGPMLRSLDRSVGLDFRLSLDCFRMHNHISAQPREVV